MGMIHLGMDREGERSVQTFNAVALVLDGSDEKNGLSITLYQKPCRVRTATSMPRACPLLVAPSIIIR